MTCSHCLAFPLVLTAFAPYLRTRAGRAVACSWALWPESSCGSGCPPSRRCCGAPAAATSSFGWPRLKTRWRIRWLETKFSSPCLSSFSRVRTVDFFCYIFWSSGSFYNILHGLSRPSRHRRDTGFERGNAALSSLQPLRPYHRATMS